MRLPTIRGMAKAFGEAVGRYERDRLAALLRRTRVEAGVQQRDLAARLGVPVSVLSKIETGHRGVDALELRAICAALGVPLADFVERLDRDLAAIERGPPSG
jgi:transcriptional regulator with XRE-family HTH domain